MPRRSTRIEEGVHFAVCDQSTHGYAGDFARKTEGKDDAVYKELTANLIGHSHMVPSGIVAVGTRRSAATRTCTAAERCR
jgi:hypothetical protein